MPNGYLIINNYTEAATLFSTCELSSPTYLIANKIALRNFSPLGKLRH